MKTAIVRLGCGFDISKDSFHTCFGSVDQSGMFRISSQRKFENKANGIAECISWIGKHLKKMNPDNMLPFQIVMEPTGVYHEAVLFALHESKLPVALELSKRVKQFLRSIGSVSKTDKKDASGICRLACERKLRLWEPFSPSIYKLRTHLRQYKSFKTSRATLLTQRHAISHSKTASPEVEHGINNMIKAYDKEILRLETLILKMYEEDSTLKTRLDPIVKSVYGLGIMTALVLVAETNGFALFTSRKQLASYAGYDIIENSSGKFSGKAKMSKAGNGRIRSSLYMVAMTIINSQEGPLYELYTRVRERNPKVYKKGNVAVQRKLLLLVFTLFKNGESFDKQRYKQERCGKQVALANEPELHEIA